MRNFMVDLIQPSFQIIDHQYCQYHYRSFSYGIVRTGVMSSKRGHTVYKRLMQYYIQYGNLVIPERRLKLDNSIYDDR